MLGRLFALVRARNIEFFRDRASLGWNIIFPVFVIVFISVAMGDDGKSGYKVGIIGALPTAGVAAEFFENRYIQLIPRASSVNSRDEAIKKVGSHQLDLFIDFESVPPSYWVNDTSPKGYFLDRLLRAELGQDFEVHRQALNEAKIRYVDWLVPGVLAMNIMFGSLFGVGYPIVRYRKNGVLKRLKATPLTAMEFLLAQVFSRLAVILATSGVVFVVCKLLLDFRMEGSVWLLMLLALVGALNLISIGILVACRLKSEELSGGLLNLLTWPMMLCSGVWFSLEGAHPLLKQLASVLPLTHFIGAARSIMIDGAGLLAITPELSYLLLTSILFMGLGAWLFRWD